MGMTSWEWEGLGILKAIPAHLQCRVQVVGQAWVGLNSEVSDMSHVTQAL